MHAATLLCLVFTVTATARPGLLHDKAHHTHEVLENIHQTPHCAYVCIFDETYQARFAPECGNLEGLTLGSCLCRADAYQYIVDQCVERKCSPNDRKKTREMNAKSCEHYGVKKEELFKLEKIEGYE